MRTLRYLALAMLTGCGHPARQTAAAPEKPVAKPAEDLSAALAPVRAKAGVPALGAAVWRGGELVAIGVSGVRKQDDPTPATARDQWHLGSDTKAMTATLIGYYVDRGKIRFEDTVGELFAGEKIDPGYAAVTIEQLLHHTGGVPTALPSDAKAASRDPGPEARMAMVRALLAQPPAQPPGTFAYANGGYIIAAAALERKLGTTWEELITRDLFQPLHMSGCGFGAPGTPGATVEQPWGHYERDGELVAMPPGPGADNPPALGPAGRVHCSLEDWGKFLAMQLRAARGEDTFVSKKTMSRLLKPGGHGFACGWEVASRSWAGGTALTHVGSNRLWYADAWIAPARNLVFVAVANDGRERTSDAVNDAIGVMIDRYAPAPP